MKRNSEGERTALFIGRFQPFHKGHLLMVKTILENFNRVVIGIGSAQYSHTVENPFTGSERKEMIERSLKKANIDNYSIALIEDIHNDERWVSHVESLVPSFDAVVTHDRLSTRLFSEKGYAIFDIDLFERERFSGTEVRRRILKGEDWRSLVPEDVARYIMDLDGEKRIREIYNKYDR